MIIQRNKIPFLKKLNYNDIRECIHSGDILICSGNSFYSKLIKHATKSVWTHVAFILKSRDIGRLMVLESVESRGVQIVPLSSYINNYLGSGKRYDGELLIARHNNFHKNLIHKISHHAIDMVTNNYSWASIAKITGRLLFGGNKKECDIYDNSQKEYICSEYVYECYKSVGIDIKHTCGYVTPADIAMDDKVKPIFLLN